MKIKQYVFIFFVLVVGLAACPANAYELLGNTSFADTNPATRVWQGASWGCSYRLCSESV